MFKVVDTSSFIYKAKSIHGDLYNYDKVLYVKNDQKVIIICNTCHCEFLQAPREHTYGSGCQKCARKKSDLKHTIPKEEFIKRAILIHGNEKYNYDNIDYVKSKLPVQNIYCNTCKEFFTQGYREHLTGSGCQKCAIKAISIKNSTTKEQFIQKAISIHGNEKYNYDNINYIKTKSIVENIYCNTCEEFFDQNGSTHIRGSGCQKCGLKKMSDSQKLSQEEFIEKCNKVHSGKYNYNEVIYVSGNEKIRIFCQIHGLFIQFANNHKMGAGCPQCGHLRSGFLHALSTEEFIEKSIEIYGNDRFDYSEVNYVNYNTKVKITCKLHKISYYQAPGIHLRSCGCFKCNHHKQYSKPQIDWLDFINNNLEYDIQYANNGGEYHIPNSPYHTDGYCKEINTIFEFNGCYFHGCPRCYPIREEMNTVCKKTYQELYDNTMKRLNFCIENGYKNIHITECFWNTIKDNPEFLNMYLNVIKECIEKKLDYSSLY